MYIQHIHTSIKYKYIKITKHIVLSKQYCCQLNLTPHAPECLALSRPRCHHEGGQTLVGSQVHLGICLYQSRGYVWQSKLSCTVQRSGLRKRPGQCWLRCKHRWRTCENFSYAFSILLLFLSPSPTWIHADSHNQQTKPAAQAIETSRVATQPRPTAIIRLLESALPGTFHHTLRIPLQAHLLCSPAHDQAVTVVKAGMQSTSIRPNSACQRKAWYVRTTYAP